MKTFSEIWIEDFEYRNNDAGNNPAPVCFCAQELFSGRSIRLWLDGTDNPAAPVKRCDGTPNRSRAAGHDCAVAL